MENRRYRHQHPAHAMRSTRLLPLRRLLRVHDQPFARQRHQCELEVFANGLRQKERYRGHATSTYCYTKLIIMKLHSKKQPVSQGSSLVVTLLTCALLGTLVGSYLYLSATQNLSVTRSQNWNQAMVVAEGGVEEAMALLNSGVQAPNFGIFPWTSAGGGVFKNDTNRPACKFGTSYYQVFITNGFAGANPVILSRGYVPGPISRPMLTRYVRVETRPRPTFPVKGPMIVMQTYNANGNNVNTDSFDSTKGAYNPKTPGTNGDVVCLTTNANSIAIGNGKLHGTVRTPPGGVQGVTATIGSNGSVGDSTWVDGGSTGFETGHFQDD